MGTRNDINMFGSRKWKERNIILFIIIIIIIIILLGKCRDRTPELKERNIIKLFNKQASLYIIFV